MRKLLYTTFLLLSLIACGDSLQDGPPKIEVFIEDSPADLQSVTINIAGVEILGTAGWSKLPSYSGTIPILDYTGGASFKLVSSPLDMGEYTKIRFIFDEVGNSYILGDRIQTLEIAPENRTVELPITMDAQKGFQYVMCDMDVAASVDTITNTLTPKLYWMDLATAGAISGVIASAEGIKIAEMVYVECTSSTGVVKGTFTNKSNGSLFIRLYAGDYTVKIIPGILSKYAPVTIENVVVKEGEATLLNAIQLTPLI